MRTREPKSYRLHPVLEHLVEQQAEDLNTSQGFIIETALVELFKDQLPPGFKPGMPVVKKKK